MTGSGSGNERKARERFSQSLGAGRRRHRAGDHGGNARRAARGRREIRPRARLRGGFGRLGGAPRRRHHVSGRGAGKSQGRARRALGAGVAQRISAGCRRRPQSVRRIAQAARSLRQYPPGAFARRFSAALRQAGRSRHRAREYRGLLCRPFHASRPRRVHADARLGDRHAQDHAARLDPHRGIGVQARAAAAQKGDRRAQGQCAARLRRALSRMRARGRRALPRRCSTRSASSTPWRRC